MSRNLIYISHKLDSRVSHYARAVLDCLLTFGDQSLDAAINIYPSNQTLADRLNISLSTVKRAKNELETLGLVVRYYDEVTNKELIKVPFAKLDEYMKKKSVAKGGSNRPELVAEGGSIRPGGGSIGTTTLSKPFLNKKGFKKTEDSNKISSPAHVPIEEVRKDGLVDINLKRTKEEREKAQIAIAAMLKNTRGY